MSATLERPFYVQFPPENLMLDKQYYIIERHANITLHASVSQGTNVSYNWIVGDMHITEAGITLKHKIYVLYFNYYFAAKL